MRTLRGELDRVLAVLQQQQQQHPLPARPQVLPVLCPQLMTKHPQGPNCAQVHMRTAHKGS